MEEIKRAEETARKFLRKNFKIYEPTPDRMDLLTRTVILNKGNKTIDELHFDVRAVLDKRGIPNPRLDRILDWMLVIAKKNSARPDNGAVVAGEPEFNFRDESSVNY